jgi:DNA-binding transcriptional LysR family regulator
VDFTQIRFFLALADTLNFTRAAELCHVTQPALTKSIQRLEAELGGPLLLRERSHTQLTALGETMRPLLQQTHDAAEQARLSAQRFQQEAKARLRIGLGSRVEPATVTPLLSQMSRRFPGLEVTLLQGSGVLLNELLLASQLDIVITEEAARFAERANRWPVYADPIVAVFADGHDLCSSATIDAGQLRSQVLVGRSGATIDDTNGDTRLEDVYALAPAIRHRGSSENQIWALVQAVGGVALSTGRRVLPAGMRSRLVKPRHAVAVWVTALAGRPMSPAADAFLRLARARDWEDVSCIE